MKNVADKNLLKRDKACERHAQKLHATISDTYHFQTTTPQIIARLLKQSESNARKFLAKLEKKGYVRRVRGAPFTPQSPAGKLWILTELGVVLAEKLSGNNPHCYPTTTDSIRMGQLNHDLIVHDICAKLAVEGYSIFATDFTIRQKSVDCRPPKYADAIVQYKNINIYIEYERTTKKPREMDQCLARAACVGPHGHTVFIVENIHRKAFWKRALAAPEVADWIQTGYKRWAQVASENDPAGRGMIWIPITIRARFHVMFIDDVYKLDADTLLVKLLEEEKTTLNIADETMKKSWSWDSIGINRAEQLCFALDCQDADFLVASTEEEWVLLPQDRGGGFFRLGFENVQLVEGDEPPIDLLDRAIFEAKRHLKARKS